MARPRVDEVSRSRNFVLDVECDRGHGGGETLVGAPLIYWGLFLKGKAALVWRVRRTGAVISVIKIITTRAVAARRGRCSVSAVRVGGGGLGRRMVLQPYCPFFCVVQLHGASQVLALFPNLL